MTSHQLLALPELRTTHGSRDARRPELHVVTGDDTERRFVTVVFVDVKDSMGLSGSIQLHEWWSVSAGLFELMCDGVYQFGGWIGNFTGDGVEAVFEPRWAADDHASRACDAALWLLHAVREPSAKLRRAHGLDLSLRIGINSGEVLTGTIGQRYKRYYTAHGYAVSLAKRMEALARPDTIYLTENTAALVTDPLQLRDLGAFEVKGARNPVEVFELLGNEPAALPTKRVQFTS